MQDADTRKRRKARSERAVTMQDVADRVGVSKMTVSAVLNGSSSHTRVSEETRQRVLAAIQEMQYHPHSAARALRRKYTNVIGVYTGETSLNAAILFAAELIGGFQEGCRERGKDLLLLGGSRSQSAEQICAELTDGRMDGLIVYLPHGDPLLARLTMTGLPLVAVTDAVQGVPSVVVDDCDGMRRLIAYLAQQGHRHLLYRDERAEATSVARRREAFYNAVAEQGMTACAWMPEREYEPCAPPLEVWRSCDPVPTAIVCWNDLAAFYILAQCRAAGVSIPRDVALTGFDALPLPPGTTQLTTIRAPWGEVGRVAVHLLDALIQGDKVAPETTLPVELVVGETA